MAVVAVVAVGGWFAFRGTDTSAERASALAAGREFAPDAGEMLSACLARDPNDVQVLETLVVWSLRRGVTFAEVEPLLDRLCELKPTDPSPWRTRAVERVRAGRMAGVIADGLKALELEPGDTDALKLVATTSLDTGDPATAERVLSRWLESSHQPSDAVAALLIRTRLQAGEVKLAEAALDKHFPPARTDPEARLQRGLVLQAAGDHTQAVTHLRAAGRRNAALAALAKSLAAVGQEGEARNVLEELDAAQARERAIVDATQRPDDLTAQVRAAEAHLADAKPAEAARLLEAARAKLGRSPESAAVLARAYRQLGREDLARKYEQEGR